MSWKIEFFPREEKKSKMAPKKSDFGRMIKFRGALA